MTSKIRARGLFILLASALALCFLYEKWYPFFVEYGELNKYSFINWEKQLLFLFMFFLGIILIAILAGSIFSIIFGRHHCNIEFYCLLGFFVGFMFGGFVMILCVLLSQDLFGLNILFYSLISGSGMGTIIGIKNEIEDDERVC